MSYKPKMQNARFWRKNENRFGILAILYYLCIGISERVREGAVYFTGWGSMVVVDFVDLEKKQ